MQMRTARDEPPVVPLLNADEAERYPLMAIMAPIYDARERVTISLLMAGFHDSQTGADIQEAGKRLQAACDRVSNFLSGRVEPELD